MDPVKKIWQKTAARYFTWKDERRQTRIREYLKAAEAAATPSEHNIHEDWFTAFGYAHKAARLAEKDSPTAAYALTLMDRYRENFQKLHKDARILGLQ